MASVIPAYMLCHLRETIRASKRILLLTHYRCDADGVGAMLALRQYLLDEGREVAMAISEPKVPAHLRFLAGSSDIQTSFRVSDYDLVILVDASYPSRTGFDEGCFRGISRLVAIDHHVVPINQEAELHLLYQLASTTQIIYEYLQYAKYKPSLEVATALLAGLYFDTGSFHFAVTEDVYAMAAQLMEAGADLEAIKRYTLRPQRIEEMRVLGRGLERMSIDEEGVLSTAITEKDLAELGAKPSEAELVTDYLTSVPEARYGLYMTQDGDRVRVSVRTETPGVNVRQIAEQYGGGGHDKAAGYRLEGKLQTREIIEVV